MSGSPPVVQESSVSVEVDADGNSRSMHADFETSLLADHV